MSNDYYFNSAYQADFWNWSKTYDIIKDHKINSKNDPKLDKIQAEIIRAKDPGQAFFCALFTNYKTHLMQQVIVDARSAKYAYAFASSIFDSDVALLQEVVIASKNIKYICQFGCFVEDSDVKKIESIIIKSKNPKYAHTWLNNVKPVNFSKLKSIIINAKTIKPQFLYSLAFHLTNSKDLKKVEDLIIKSGSCKYIRLLAENVEGANIRKLENAILATNNAKEIRKFANIKGSRLNSFSLLF